MEKLIICFFLLLAVAGCSSQNSELDKALSSSVREKKLSPKKMESILAEYDKLRDEDNVFAREYVDQILNAIEMGGDSTHIDAARRHVLRKKNEKKISV